MKKRPKYPPLEIISQFEKSSPGIFERDVSEYSSGFEESSYNFCPEEKDPAMSSEQRELASSDIVSIFANWRRTKQVYKVSPILQEMILDTEDFEFSSDLFEYLPYDYFYIELANEPVMHGIFFQLNKPEKCIQLIFVSKEKYIWFACFPFLDTEDTFYQQIENLFSNNPEGMNIDTIKKCSILAIQFAMYLCAQNCDIQENEEQKRIYRPIKDTIKDKYSEIRKWDVGYRIASDRPSRQGKPDNTKVTTSTSQRNRPRQHWRKAHWHTYWVGKGRTQKVLRFIAPMLINNINDDLPVVEHK